MKFSKKSKEEIQENWNKKLCAIALISLEINCQFRKKYYAYVSYGNPWKIDESNSHEKFFNAGIMFATSKTPEEFFEKAKTIQI